MKRNSRRAGDWVDRVARKLVQIGFLALALYPLVPLIWKRLTFKPAPTLTSWLLPWDPLLGLGKALHQDWGLLVLGAPLLILALTLVVGRSFCGWACPLGTLLDLVRPLAWWQKHPRGPSRRGRLVAFPAERSSPVRYYLLVAALAGSLLSLQVLGALDPLVIVQRTATALAADYFALGRVAARVYLTMSALMVVILGLELWQPRFWCRHLCPLGALLSLGTRFTLLNRRVSTACNGCGACRRACPMRAIASEPHDTDYAACHFCLECEGICPQKAISFGFGGLSARRWQPGERGRDAAGRPHYPGRYVPRTERVLSLALSRRDLALGVMAGVMGLAVPPALRATWKWPLIRPPGALPEEEFVRQCILCQECVRVCATGGLRPVFMEGGPGAIGTPRLVPRQGGCSLIPSCPDLCARVCPVGAIRPVAPEKMKLGLAEVDHRACLAWDQGVKCLVCVEACATGAAQAYHGKIIVEPARCTGCGRCEDACPVAGAAIRVRPLS